MPLLEQSAIESSFISCLLLVLFDLVHYKRMFFSEMKRIATELFQNLPLRFIKIA